MKLLIVLIVALSPMFIYAQDQSTTVFEKSNGAKTGTYAEVIQFYKTLAAASSSVQIRTMAKTDSGHPLHLVIVDHEKNFDLELSRKKGKTLILIINGIHPGEPDGIEASQLLAREYAQNGKNNAFLKDLVIAIVPVYNIGGALNRNSYTRVNQNGPEAYGFRGNARNYDLNRDFMKADTKNTKAFYEIFHLVKPHIFIDTHVSNGADYQYSITHLATQHDKLGGEVGDYIYNSFIPDLETIMGSKGSEVTQYVNVFNTTPDANGIEQFFDLPRYSTGYTALFNTLGFMIETHMLKPFQTRVEATYDFLESVIELAARDSKKIQRLHKNNLLKPGNKYPISWKLDHSKHQLKEFKGYEGEIVKSDVTGQERLFYNRNKPYVKKIPYFNTYVPSKLITLPRAYVIPQGWHNIIDRMKQNNIRYSQFENDTVIHVESYAIENFETSSNPYEGHYIHSNVTVSSKTQKMDFKAGDYLIYIDQIGGRYIVETLEPESPDSFFNWNFFDTILQQREHFSPYVFEDLALRLLKENPQMRQALEQKKKKEKAFAKNGFAQLNFIYKNSAFYEDTHMRYPVYRIL